MNISPLARKLLQLHAENPDRLFYGTDILGGLFRDTELADLDGAYQDLEEAKLMAPSGEISRFFGSFKTLYQLTEAGKNAASGFLHGLVGHLQSYAHDQKVAIDDVYVRLTLADGTSFFTRGLRIDDPHQGQQCTMIRGMRESPRDARVIRESHIVKAELDVDSGPQSSIGFHAEITS